VSLFEPPAFFAPSFHLQTFTLRTLLSIDCIQAQFHKHNQAAHQKSITSPFLSEMSSFKSDFLLLSKDYFCEILGCPADYCSPLAPWNGKPLCDCCWCWCGRSECSFRSIPIVGRLGFCRRLLLHSFCYLESQFYLGRLIMDFNSQFYTVITFHYWNLAFSSFSLYQWIRYHLRHHQRKCQIGFLYLCRLFFQWCPN